MPVEGSAGTLRPAVHIVRRKHRQQHPWVFSNEVMREEGNPMSGQTVRVYERGRFVGSGLYNRQSLIRLRLYSDSDEELDRALLRRRIEAAWRYRQWVLPGEDDFRLVYGESDYLPGLVVDKYGRHFVVQAYSAGMDCRLAEVTEILADLFDVAAVFEKDDLQQREFEGLERRERLLYGTVESEIAVRENGVRFLVNINAGQKTGYYFDHRLTRRRVRELAKGLSVLDLFCYTGSFAVNAALGKARRVTGVDSSAPACMLARENARLNSVAELCEFVEADVLKYMAELERRGQQFELINLDPPSFIKRKSEKTAGLRRYRAVNRLAMRLLAPGGILVSSSCSHHLGWQEMLNMLIMAASDSGRSFIVLERIVQGPDHPVLLIAPETEYLRGFILQLN